MSPKSSLAHRVAVVTGGSRGLGRGVVEALASRGVRVVAIARSEGTLAAMSREVPGVAPIAGDAADETLAERVLRQETPDLVVLCAGAMPVLGPIHEHSWEDFQTNWNVDTKSTFVWLRHALRLPMKRGAHVVIVSSGAAVQGSRVSGGYASAKRAMVPGGLCGHGKRSGRPGSSHSLPAAQLEPGTELGRAGIRAYAERAGITPEEFAKRFHPPLTPEVMGKSVVELFEAPERFPQLAYRVGGAGVAPLG